jgi:hypothetical protein
VSDEEDEEVEEVEEGEEGGDDTGCCWARQKPRVSLKEHGPVFEYVGWCHGDAWSGIPDVCNNSSL